MLTEVDPRNPFLDDDEPIAVTRIPTFPKIVKTVERKPYERNYTPEKKAELKAQVKAGVTPPGHKKREPGPQPRKKLTEQDLKLFKFLFAFPFATDRQIALVLGVKKTSAYGRLRSLRASGWVTSVQAHGACQLWIAKKSVVKELENLDPDYDYSSIQWQNASKITDSRPYHTLGVIQIAAHLVGNTNVIMQSPWPITVDDLVTEEFIQKSFKRKAGEYDQWNDLNAVYKTEARSALIGLKNGKFPVRELAERYPALWTPSGSFKASTAHYPDLVLNLEKHRTGKQPVSIAFEFERSKKGADEYDKIHRAYAEEKLLFAKIVWVCASELIANLVLASAERIGIADRVEIMPLICQDGELYSGPESL